MYHNLIVVFHQHARDRTQHPTMLLDMGQWHILQDVGGLVCVDVVNTGKYNYSDIVNTFR